MTPLVWRYKLPAICRLGRYKGRTAEIAAVDLENDVPLSCPHSIYENMLNFGSGRYRHWGEYIYFYDF